MWQVVIPIAMAAISKMMDKGSNTGTSALSSSLRRFSAAPYESSTIQNMLPPSLGMGATSGMMNDGMRNISEMMSKPGMLRGGVSAAALPGQSMRSDELGRIFSGALANKSGAASAANLPVNIRAAIMSALGGSQEAAQRGVRGEAYGQSEGLRRQDSQEVYKVMDAILQYMSSGKGQAIQGLGGAAQLDQANSAARTAQWGALIQGLGQALGSGGGGSSAATPSTGGWYGDTFA